MKAGIWLVGGGNQAFLTFGVGERLLIICALLFHLLLSTRLLPSAALLVPLCFLEMLHADRPTSRRGWQNLESWIIKQVQCLKGNKRKRNSAGQRPPIRSHRFANRIRLCCCCCLVLFANSSCCCRHQAALVPSHVLSRLLRPATFVAHSFFVSFAFSPTSRYIEIYH